MSETLQALAGGLRADGGLLADATVDPAAGLRAPLGDLAAAGRRTRECAADYALLVEAIHEGYLQHYATGRVLRPEDPDLALLAGDRLYAIGLDRLAALGDVEAVAALADVISRVAQAHAEGQPGRAESAWEAGARSVGGIVLRPTR